MATTDLERLVVSLEASTVKYERAMSKALGVTTSTMQRIERRNAAMVQRVGSGFSGLQRGIATAFAGAAALRGAQQLIDASTRIENSLKAAGLEGEQLARVYDDLFVSAQRNAAPIEALVDLYSRASLVQKELGVSTEELLNFTDKVAVALRVSGKSAQESSGALLQLSQALGSGVVRAEEFNSLLEGALPIAQAAAAGLEEAGGSVAKLRALVVDGKVSSEAFFRAFELGSVVLTDKVANAELTVSQQFVRLQNVLIDTAGKFDDATGASARIGSGLEQLAELIGLVGTAIEQNKESITWFIDALGTSAAGMPIFADILRGVEAIKTLGRASKEGGDQVKQSAEEVEAAILDTIAAMVGLDNAASFSPEQLSTFQALVDQMVAGEAGADDLRAALADMGATPVNFMVVIGALGGLIDKLRLARGEANATAAAVAAAASGQTAGSNIDGQRAEQLANRGAGQVAPSTISIKDPRYAVPPSSSGGGGGGKSGADQFAAALASQRQRIEALNRETELMRQLGPLVNDYGYSIERLKAQIELENAAKEAGLPLDETRARQIEELASGYGLATAEAARLAEEQDKVRQTAEDLANASRQALDTIIDGFLEGRDAGEIFNSALKELGRSLINIGLNSLFGGGGGLGGLLGGLFGGRGFATGTANTGGQRGEPRGVVHGQEAVIPLPAGGNIPVDIRMPPVAAPVTGGDIRVTGEFQVVEGNLVPVITRISGQVSGQQVKAYDRQLPNRMQDIQMRQG